VVSPLNSVILHSQTSVPTVHAAAVSALVWHSKRSHTLRTDFILEGDPWTTF